MEVTVTKDFTFAELYKKLIDKASEEYDKEFNSLLDELERISPVGATGDLSRSWRYERDDGTLNAKITNISKNSLERVVGNPPGPISNPQDLIRWTKSKGLPYLPVAVKIEREGTDRFQTGDNILNADKNGELRSGNPIQEAADKVIAKVNKIDVE